MILTARRASVATLWFPALAAAGGVFTADLPPGTSGASGLHDENRNGHIETNPLGVPTEGYGVASGGEPHRRAATFNEATSALRPGGTTVTIGIRYDLL